MRPLTALLTATVRIYVDAAREAGKAFSRSAWAFLTLLLCFPLLAVVGLLVAPLGIIGGLILSILNAACAGTYLAMLRDVLSVRRSLGPAAVRSNLGASTWDIINVLFPIWIVDLLLSLLGVPAVVPLVFGIAVVLFLNPVPEMIGRSRNGGLELLREAAQFMMNHGPEWLIPQVGALALLWLAFPTQALPILSLFGPRFGFTTTGSLAMSAGSGAVGWAIGFGLVALVHLLMLFRGALYLRLSGAGGRRAREWSERLR
ncbi:MAG: hypothetical protein Q8P18_24240 [Pseudomonadota bacterium]|nr:hypothetical protein [Pseudomonadota bacterium]